MRRRDEHSKYTAIIWKTNKQSWQYSSYNIVSKYLYFSFWKFNSNILVMKYMRYVLLFPSPNKSVSEDDFSIKNKIEEQQLGLYTKRKGKS